MDQVVTRAPRRGNRGGFSLVEVLVASAILAMTIPMSMATIQWSRFRSQALSHEMVAQNLILSLMEMVKRSGYNEVVYGAEMPDLLSGAGLSPLLNFPVGQNPPNPPLLPAGAAGGATAPEQYCYSSGQPSAAILSSSNYLTLSQDQIAALNGYADYAAVPSGEGLLNTQMAWGIYIEAHTSPAMTYPVKLVVLVVKWNSERGRATRFITLSTLVSNRTPRI